MSRIDPAVLAIVRQLLTGQDKPEMRQVMRALQTACKAAGRRSPSRATLYNLINTIEASDVPISSLPARVRAVLYNIDPNASAIPGRQLAYHCFNYGDEAALCYGAGMPWLALHQAETMRGFRPKSLALLRAVMFRRGIRRTPA